jgi:hypothetical protein
MNSNATINNNSDLLHDKSSRLFEKDDLEIQLASFKKEKIEKLNFSIIIKPLSISLIALILSFFLDLSSVPLLGYITIDFAKVLFPEWQPLNQAIEPISFWWVPVVSYLVFVGFAFKAFNELKNEVTNSTSSEIIDRFTGSAASVVDGIATALPLIGAALLLISIKLGPEIFLGLAVPFEIKSLIVLALGKLFEPVFDTLGVEFQHVINRAQEVKERYYTEIQLRNSRKLLAQMEKQISKLSSNGGSNLSVNEMEMYNSVLEKSLALSKETYKYISATSQLLEKINNLSGVDGHKLEELKSLSNSLLKASEALKDGNTVAALKSIENIIVKR